MDGMADYFQIICPQEWLCRGPQMDFDFYLAERFVRNELGALQRSRTRESRHSIFYWCFIGAILGLTLLAALASSF